ncbi:MAG: hypothetical protein WC722_05735 [Rhodospirillales bacterium]|jgi:hypothetical protein
MTLVEVDFKKGEKGKGRKRPGRGDDAPPPPEERESGLPPDCPVMPLGISVAPGKQPDFFFSSPMGAFVAMGPRAMTESGLQGLFAGQGDWLRQHFSIKDGHRKGALDVSRLREALMDACVKAGIINPATAIRGPGLWPMSRTLVHHAPAVLHLGDRVFVLTWDASGRLGPVENLAAGVRLGDFVYPRAEKRAYPAATPATPEQVAGLERLVNSWDYEDQVLMPRLVMGHMAAACIPGLLQYRPSMPVLAPGGSGKTALIVLERDLVDGWGGPNITAAAIRERFIETKGCEAVTIDEAEASGEDSRRALEIAAEARHAYDWGHGTFSRGAGIGSGNVQGIFAFGAINRPPAPPQDQGRDIVIQLKDVMRSPEQIARFEAWRIEIVALGPAFRRRMIEARMRVVANFNVYRGLLAAAGFSSRLCNTWGTVLACADAAISDVPTNEDSALPWVNLVAAHLIEAPPETTWEVCLNHILFAFVDEWGGGSKKVMRMLIEEAVGNSDGDAGKRIQNWGLKVVQKEVDPDKGPQWWLFVASKLPSTAELFRAKQTPWTHGGWGEALRGVPGSVSSALERILGSSNGVRGTLIPIGLISGKKPGSQAGKDVKELGDD